MEADNTTVKPNLLQRLMSQQLLVVGDTHEEDENGHLVENAATMTVVYRYIAVLHESDYSFRLWLETGNQYADALSELGYQVLDLRLKTIRQDLNNQWFERVAAVYEQIRTYAFEENQQNNKKSDLIRHIVSKMNNEDLNNCKAWLSDFVVPIENEAEEICKQAKPADCIDIVVIGNIHAYYLAMKGYPTVHVSDDGTFLEYAFINKILRELI